MSVLAYRVHRHRQPLNVDPAAPVVPGRHATLHIRATRIKAYTQVKDCPSVSLEGL
jgi:hypothetical protein